MTQSPEKKKVWRIIELIHWTTSYLQEKDFPTPRTDVEWLLTSVLNCSRVQLYADFEKPLTPEELSEFKTLLKLRLEYKPVQYIIGKTEFMGLPFHVDERVLIPRPETEILVETAVDWLRKQPKGSRKALDIGTGSGCIAVSIAALAPKASIVALDTSPEAIQVAEENAVRNRVQDKIIFQHTDILESDPGDVHFNLIVSNPPYIGENERPRVQKDVLKYEPEEALFTGNDGLTFFRHFAAQSAGWLKDGGKIMLETGGDHQSQPVRELFRENGWKKIEILKDYNRQGRILTASK